MSDASSPSDEPVIKHALLCASCSYNLQSLPADALCPECARPISETLRGDLLALADPIWVKNLYRGTRLMTTAILVPLIAIIGALVALLIIEQTMQPMAARKADQVVITISLFTIILALLAALWGGLLATTPEPFRLDSQPDRYRSHTRWSGSLWGSVIFLVFLHSSGTSLFFLFPGRWSDITTISLLAASSSYHYWAATHYIQSLARRMPDPDLAETARKRRSRMILWTTVGFFLLGLGPLVAFIIFLVTIERLCNGLERVVEDMKLRQLAAASTADLNS